MQDKDSTVEVYDRFPRDEIKEKVRTATDFIGLVETYGTPLKKVGTSHQGLCPFHEDKSPSFSVDESKKMFHCFGCGAKGDVFDFVARKEGLNTHSDFPKVLEKVASIAGVDIAHKPQKKIYGSNKQRVSNSPFHRASIEKVKTLYSKPIDDLSFYKIQTYFKSRHIPITKEMAQALSIQIDNQNILWMPCKDVKGDVVRSWWRQLTPSHVKLPGEKSKLYNHKSQPDAPSAIVIPGNTKRIAIFEGVEDALTYYYLKGQSTGETILACCSAGNFPKMVEFCKDADSVTVYLDGDLPKTETDYPCLSAPSVQFATKLACGLPRSIDCRVYLPEQPKNDINASHCKGRGDSWLTTLIPVEVETVPDYTLPFMAQFDCADKFVEQYQGKYCLDLRNDSWMVLNNNWRKDELGCLPSAVGKFVRDISITNALDAKLLREVRKQSYANGVLSSVSIDLNMRRLEWDTDQMLLGTPGETVDLKTGEKRPARASDYISKQTKVIPQAGTPTRWLQFLQEVTRNDSEMVHYIHKLVGYMLTGYTSEESLIVIYGEGGNGKTIFFETLLAIFGDYGLMASMGAFMEDKLGGGAGRACPEIMRLEGSRLVVCNEIEEGHSWAEAKVKALTSDKVFTGRQLYQEERTFTPTFKVMVIGNYKPNLKNVDEAMKRRLHLIPFLFKPETPDKHLREKLLAEAPQILQWAIDGCLLWQKDGLEQPKAVKEATAEYFEEQDTINQWLEECCSLSPLVGDKPSHLSDSYGEFVGEKITPKKMHPILRKLAEKHPIHFIKNKKVNGKLCRWWSGIKVNQDIIDTRFKDNDAVFDAPLHEQTEETDDGFEF